MHNYMIENILQGFNLNQVGRYMSKFFHWWLSFNSDHGISWQNKKMVDLDKYEKQANYIS